MSNTLPTREELFDAVMPELKRTHSVAAEHNAPGDLLRLAIQAAIDAARHDLEGKSGYGREQRVKDLELQYNNLGLRSLGGASVCKAQARSDINTIDTVIASKLGVDLPARAAESASR